MVLLPSIRHQRRLLVRLSLFSLCVFLLLGGFYFYDQYPPNYELEIAGRQRSSFNPQTRYVLFKQIRGAGFNNQLQEYLLHRAVAHASGRAMVYQDLIWRYRGYDEVPLEAFSHSLTQSPSIHEDIFWTECGDQVKNITIKLEDNSTRWHDIVTALTLEDARCIRVEKWLFHWSFLESEEAVNIWPHVESEFSSFRWSDRLYRAFNRNAATLGLSSNWAGVLAIHLRRGDFSYHCVHNAEREAKFNLWNNHPSLPMSGTKPSSYQEIYSRCFPSFDQVHATVSSFLSSHKPKITHLHVLHSGAWDTPMTYSFVYRLKSALTSRFLDLKVSHTGMLDLHFNEKDFAVAVDMEIARRAGAFIGNGYSSLTSDVVGWRLADRTWPSSSNQFW